MQIKEFIENVCNQIKYKPIRNEISEELKNHIEESKEDFIQNGMEEKQAEEKAVNLMGNAEEIGKKLNKIHKPKLDWKLLIITAIVIGFGILVTFVKAMQYLKSYGEIDFITKHIIFLIFGLVLSIGVYFIDYKKIFKYSTPIYILATLIIIYAILFGVHVNGIPYIYCNFMALSPSVIAMPLYTIAFIGFIQNINKDSKIEIKFLKEKNINVNLIKIIILSVISLMLLRIIPSMTSTLILALTYLIIGTVKLSKTKKNRKRNIAILWGIPAVIVILISFHYIISWRAERIIVGFNPEIDPNGAGWLGINRKQIINSANGFGEADDMSNALSLFDEGTNFAFISILAHYGWVVSIGMIISIILLNTKLIINSVKIKDMYGKLLIIGISCVFILQSTFNILMNFNLGIEADFNIPLISYGGANLIINMVCLALVLSIYRRKDILCKNTEKIFYINTYKD